MSQLTDQLRRNLVPPPGLPRRIATTNLLWGVGTGTFLTGSSVYFTQVVGLTPVQIGLGLSLAAGAGLVGSVPLSRFTDRFGPKRVWLTTIGVQAVAFSAYLVAHGFWAYLAIVLALELANTTGSTARNVYMIELLDPKTRVMTLAFGRAWINVGWSLGAGLAGAALAWGTVSGYQMMVLTNVALQAATLVLVARLPFAAHQAGAAAAAPSRWRVFRDRPFLSVTALCGLLACFVTVEMEVAPLWLINRTDAPHWMLAVLTTVNTLMATTMQVALTRGTETLSGATRVLRWGGWAAALGCPVYFLTGLSSGLTTLLLLVTATVLLTLSEMWQSAGAWTIAVELAPGEQKAAYQGAFRMGNQAEKLVGPVALISLAFVGGGWGWLVIGGVFAVAALVLTPVVSWADATRRPMIRADGSTAPDPAVA